MRSDARVAIDIHAHAETIDFPVEKTGYRPEVKPLIFKDNGARQLGLGA